MGNSAVASGCCCPQANNYACISDCIFGTTIDTGCCHWDDTLVLWNNRPAYSIRQQYRQGSCETCSTTSQAAMQPVQSIYRYHSCWFRFVYPGPSGPVSLVTLPKGNNDFGQGTGCANPVCNPDYCPDDCCNDNALTDPGTCLCNAWFGTGNGGFSNWRRNTLEESPDSTWFVEMICHNDGNPLHVTDGIPRISSGFLCNVFFERWWKIADCAPSTRIYVPGCTQTSESSDCDGVPFVTSDLVPKWWIFGCSGIPLYQWELDEALDLEVIDAGEYTEIMDAITSKEQPPQAPILKMAYAGYLVAKDWREQQRQAYIELNQRFPSAGYGSCIESLESMHELAPFRKRYTATAPLSSGGSDIPYLHNADVIDELVPFQAECTLKDFPGGTQSDYDFWRLRQWVYFRGIPGGWTWAGWNSASGTGLTEEQAILAGYGRAVGIGGDAVITAPMLAFAGQPRPEATVISCGSEGNEVCADTTFCDTIDDACEECGEAPVAACDPPSVCRKFTLHPVCEGVRFLASQYQFTNRLESVDGDCVTAGKYVCLYVVESFLVEARRRVDRWDYAIPYRCRTMDPPLGAFQDFDFVEKAHFPPQEMCDAIIDATNPFHEEYDGASSLCCGAKCVGFENVLYGDGPCFVGSDNEYPCPELQATTNVCPEAGPCPPHGTTKQLSCLTHPIICLAEGEGPPTT